MIVCGNGCRDKCEAILYDFQLQKALCGSMELANTTAETHFDLELERAIAESLKSFPAAPGHAAERAELEQVMAASLEPSYGASALAAPASATARRPTQPMALLLHSTLAADGAPSDAASSTHMPSTCDQSSQNDDASTVCDFHR